MNSTDNIQIVKNYWQAESEKNMEKVLEFFDLNARFISPFMDLQGRDEIQKFYQKMFKDYKDIKVKINNYIEQNNELAVEYKCKLIDKNDVEKNAEGCNIFQIKEGKIKRLRSYFNPEDF